MNGALSPDERLTAAATWYVRLSDGALSVEEERALQLWLDEHPDNKAAFDAAARGWGILDACAAEPELVTLRGAAFETARHAYLARGMKSVIVQKIRYVAIAAGLALVLLLSGLWLNLQPELYSTGTGERKLIALADGSKLSLDAATDVEVRYTDGRRSLMLKRGRAKFDVAKDPLRPFTVEAGGKTVVATGTSFSVELAASQVRVVLYEGKVSVLPSGDAGRPADDVARPGLSSLNPGQELVLAKASFAPVVHRVDPARERAWEEGRLDFNEEPLSLAVERLNRYSAESQVVVDPKVSQVRISGVFNTGDTRAFVEGVTAIFPVEAEPMQGGSIRLKAKRQN